MKNYVKPMIMLHDDFAEGVFAASGDCMTVDFLPGTRNEQTPEGYKIGFEFKYNHISYDHCNHGCRITAVFPCAVKVVEVTNGVTMEGNGTNTIVFTNPNALHAAGNNAETSTITIVALVTSADLVSQVYSFTTATITDAGMRDYDCPTHSHMYK